MKHPNEHIPHDIADLERIIERRVERLVSDPELRRGTVARDICIMLLKADVERLRVKRAQALINAEGSHAVS